MLNSAFSAKPLSTWCIQKSYAFEMEPLQPGLPQAIILPDSGPPQRLQNSFPAVASLSLAFCLADFCFLLAEA